MAMDLITKALFLNYLACPTLGWIERSLKNERTYSETLTPAEELRILEGKEIGERARSVFPGGVLIDAKKLELAAKQTQIHMHDTGVSVIFEATFISNGFVAKADILVRDKNQWNLIEVKSALHDDESVSSEHIDDLAYTAFVASGTNVNLGAIEIMRISKAFRLGSLPEELFRRKDCREEVLKRVGEFRALADRGLRDLQSAEIPKAKLNSNCKKCGHFSTRCLGKDLKHPIVEIPLIREKKLLELFEDNILEIKDVPEEFKLTENQQKVVKAVKIGKPSIDRTEISRLLGGLSWPIHYLDFETMLTALPLYPNVAPHQAILTQYSLHVRKSHHCELVHFEYLAPHERDSRRELAEHLLSNLGNSGSIVVYSSYEKTQLNVLSREHPDLKDQIESCINRLFDLEKLFSTAFYHPDFCGSTSIKKVLPVLVPKLSYSGLEIADGGAAVAMFVKMARGGCDESEIQQIRAALLKYCHLDTLAMVKLHLEVEALI
jgi:hypothetical protein